MALDFPANPTNGQVYDSYVYNSTVGAWQAREDSATVAITSPTAPATANNGDIWYNSNTGVSYVYYADGTSAQWVEIVSSAVPLLDTKANLSGANFTGNISAPQLVSTIATGTTPLSITSTTLVSNLNADLLDGNHATAFSPAAGSSSITTVGTITSGTWNGTTLAVANGGTGATTLTSGGYLKGAGTGAITSQAGIPAGDITSGSLVLARGGTNASLTATAGGVLYSTASAMAISAAGTSGLSLISGGTGAPTWGYPTSSCVRLTSTIAQSTSGTAGAASYYQWSADSFSSGMWSSGANTRITPNRAGKWRVSAKIRYVATSGAAGYVQVQMNRASNSPSEGLQTDSIGGAYPWAQDIFNVTNVGTDYFETAFFSTGITHGTTQANAIMLAEYIGP